MKFIILILMLFTVTANAAKFRYNSTEFGAADNSDIYIYANNDDVAPYPALMYNFATGKWTLSNDGILFYDLLDSSSGSVVGPTSALDNAIARYDLTTGKLIQGSNVLIDDSDNISGINNLTVTGTTTLDTALTGPVKLTAGVLSASSVDLTSEITGVLPIANGGTNSSTALGNDKVIISSTGSLIESATTSTQLGFLDATSSIQTQINAKEDTLPWNTNGDMVYLQSAGNIIKIPAGTQDQVLTMGASSNPLWSTAADPSPTTTEGDLIVRGAAVDERLAAHATSGFVMTSNGAGAIPSYQAPPVSTTLTQKGELQGFSTVNAAIGPCLNDGEYLVRDSTDPTDWVCSSSLTGAFNPMTDYFPCTITPSGFATSAQTLSCKILGDILQVSGHVTVSSVTSGMGFNVVGYSMDTSKQDITRGVFTAYTQNGGNKFNLGHAAAFGGTGLINMQDDLVFSNWTTNVPQPAWTAGDSIGFVNVKIPMLGLSSGLNAVVQRKINARSKMSASANLPVSDVTETAIVFAVSNYDNIGMNNIAGNSITIPHDGVYTIIPKAVLSNTVTTSAPQNSRGFISFKTNGGSETFLGTTRLPSATNVTGWAYEIGTLSHDIELSSGDVLTFFIEHNFGANVQLGSDAAISIKEHAGSPTIAGVFGNCQEKFLSGDIGAGGQIDITSLRFTNITIGSRYRLCLNPRTDYPGGADNIDLLAKDNGNTFLIATMSSATNLVKRASICRSYIPTATSITFNANSVGTGNFMRGNGTHSETWVELCEDNRGVTTQW